MCNRTSNAVNVEAKFSPGAIEEWLSILRDGNKVEKGHRLDISMNAKKHLSALGWVFHYVQKGQRRELRYVSPEGKCFYSLATACKSCVEAVRENAPKLRHLAPQESSASAFCDKGSLICNATPVADDPGSGIGLGGSKLLSKSKKSKRKRQGLEDCSNLKKRKRIGQGLEDCLDGAEVLVNGGTPESKSKISKPNNEKEESGERERTGEEEFEYVVKPGMGKSLKKMLELMEEKEKVSTRRSSTRLRSASRSSITDDMNADACSMCHWGGELVLCDGCPSAFHYGCIGLTDLPEGDLWFCPSCCCGICGSRKSTHDNLVTCEQCQSSFHFGCVKQEVEVSYKGLFCSTQCEHVFSALDNLLGKKITVGDGALVWTLLRGPQEDEFYDVELISKLHRGVKLLHQCFEPSKDPFTGRDLVEDVIFGGESMRARLNFHRFYTVILEKKNKVVTVATVRVFKDIAEIPFVATDFKHRKYGMCRTLMNELEKQMREIGVRRLVLPAVTGVLSTWTEGFGFSVMEGSERLKLRKHTFLDFNGTVMCHKFLQRRPNSAESSLTEEDKM